MQTALDARQLRDKVHRLMPGIRTDLERLVRIPSVGHKGFDLSQVIVHKKDGTIQTEWTYGEDPENYPG